MAITNLLLKTKPEEIPDFLRGRFFELYGEIHTEEVKSFEYMGWVHIGEDGTIEFGEPGA